MEEKHTNNYINLKKLKQRNKKENSYLTCCLQKELMASVKQIYIYCNIPVPKRDTVCRIKPASVNQALQKKKKTKLTGIGAGEITEEYWFMYT